MQDKLFRKNALERLQSPERLDSLMQVTQPFGWITLAVIIALLLVLGAWAFLTPMPTTLLAEGALEASDEGGLYAILYLPAEDAQQVKFDQEVLLSPVTSAPQDFGYLKGRVVSIGDRPTDDTLADTILPNQAAFVVIVALQTDEETPSGYAWSIGDGPDVQLRPSLSLTAQIILSEDHPINRLLPF